MAKTSVVPVRRGYWGNKIGKPHTVPTKATGKCGSVTVSLTQLLYTVAPHPVIAPCHHCPLPACARSFLAVSVCGNKAGVQSCPASPPALLHVFCQPPANINVKTLHDLALAQVRLIPAPRGAGIVAARVPKKVLQMAGIDDCYTASRGSTKTLGNFVKVRWLLASNAGWENVSV